MVSDYSIKKFKDISHVILLWPLGLVSINTVLDAEEPFFWPMVKKKLTRLRQSLLEFISLFFDNNTWFLFQIAMPLNRLTIEIWN
jgi:hypothetical protein